jgi:multiple sugar transport system permease protein
MSSSAFTLNHIPKIRFSPKKTKDLLIAFSFILPNFIGYTILTIIPIGASFVLSFFNWSGGRNASFAGWYNYTQLVRNSTFGVSLLNTFYLWIGVMPATTILAIGLALLLNQDFKARNFVRSACFFPHVASVITIAGVWNMLFNPVMGPVNTFLSSLGIKNLPGWASDVHWAMPMAILCSIWKSVGYFMVIYLAALQTIPRDLYEAARIDGANPWQSFKRITVPMLTPTTFFVMMMLTINCFQSFDLIYVLTKGGPGRATTTLVLHIYNSFSSYQYGYAITVSIVLLFIVIIITILQFQMERKWVSYM